MEVLLVPRSRHSRPPSHNSADYALTFSLLITSRHGPRRKPRIYCRASIRCSENVFAEPFTQKRIWNIRPSRAHFMATAVHATMQNYNFSCCGLVLRVPGYRSRDPGFEFPELPDFLRSSGSGTGYTRPRQDN
jgi:hypothetical protein